MATRTIEHEKETIACRFFEQALTAKLVAQATSQGADYGIDFTVSVFKDGAIDRTYQVQVKYLNQDLLIEIDLRESMLLYNHYSESNYGESYLPYSFKKSTLRDYLKMSTQIKTLLVCANNENLYSLWFNDYYDYFLKWLPTSIDGKGTVQIYFHGYRCLTRLQVFKDDEFSTELMIFPGHSGYEKAKDGFFTDSLFNKQSGWIGDWYDTGILDSLSSIGISAYLAIFNRRAVFKKKFNTHGFWEFILPIQKKQPFILLCFANFIGYLEPVSKMLDWASEKILSFDDYLSLPVALQIMANCKDIAKIELIIDKLETLSKTDEDRFYPGLLFSRFSRLSLDIEHDNRLNTEFAVALSKFLQQIIITFKSVRSQRLLLSGFYNFDYSVNFVNAFARSLVLLIEKNKLIKRDKSYQALKQILQYNGNDKKELVEAVAKKNSEWAYEDTWSK